MKLGAKNIRVVTLKLLPTECQRKKFKKRQIKMRDSYNGSTPPFQGGDTGSIPVSRSVCRIEQDRGRERKVLSRGGSWKPLGFQERTQREVPLARSKIRLRSNLL